MRSPIWLQDDFMGDYSLVCPNCKTEIRIPIPFKALDKPHLPHRCKTCGEEFDWSFWFDER